MNLVWTTDTHLNFLTLEKILEFCKSIREQKPDAVVITGDITESPLLLHHLLVLEKEVSPAPVFFVCGNHDYYHASIADIRQILTENYSYSATSKTSLTPGAYWLGSSGVIPLTNSVALVGHDGWYDGCYSNYFASRLVMNDYHLISELCHLQPETRYDEINRLARESAGYIRDNLQKAFLDGFKTVYVATHVPPFLQSCLYNGKRSNEDWLPCFSSKKMGDMLLEVGESHPDKNIIVLCGHSHGEAYYAPLDNLQVYTGKAVYKNPKVNNTFAL